jgi:molybdopterin-guanine dinucleotide biosynthesis protein A
MALADADLRSITLAILAGGEGSRMGHAKAEIRLGDRPILDVLLERFAWPGPTLLVTAPGREHPTGWRGFTREVTDPGAGQGPLRGVLTALEQASTPVVVFTGVDMPLVGRDQFAWLAERLSERPAALGLMLRRGAQIEPLPSAFRAGATGLVRRMLESGRRSLHGLLADPAIEAVEAPDAWDERTWTNLNSPADLDGLT